MYLGLDSGKKVFGYRELYVFGSGPLAGSSRLVEYQDHSSYELG